MAKKRKPLSDLVPTNWLDPLLTGPDAVLKGTGGTWGCPDIERPSLDSRPDSSYPISELPGDAMTRPVVYLAGPIAGTKQGEAFSWRDEAAAALAQRDIDTRSPMRAKQELFADRIGHDYRAYSGRGWAYTPDGILTRDHNDCTTADAVLIHVFGAKTLSFGTGMELAWCYDHHIPTVVAIEESGNVHDNHPMFVAAVKFRVPTLEEAVDAVAVILGR